MTDELKNHDMERIERYIRLMNWMHYAMHIAHGNKAGNAKMSNHDEIWNESVFDGFSGAELERMNDLFNAGLAQYEPQPCDLSAMTRDEVIAHAHATRDAALAV